MFQQWLNWRSLLAIIAVIIVIGTIFYSRLLAGKIAREERHKVEAWAEAQQFIAKATPEQDILFATIIMAGQTEIPVIETNEKDSITNYHNIDSLQVARHAGYLPGRLREFKKANSPIITYLDAESSTFNRYYYGESVLLKKLIP